MIRQKNRSTKSLIMGWIVRRFSVPEPMRFYCLLRHLLCGVFGVFCWTSMLLAVEISEPRWGFDGKVRPNNFNLLTVTVDNPAPVPVEFDLVLRKWAGAGPIDAPIVEQKIYMAPGTRRIVQLYPYVTGGWQQWRLYWEKQFLELPDARNTQRGARVMLESADVLGDSKGTILHFMESQFPPFVTATDSLQAVVLDHDPRQWDEPRRTAFRDWIFRGGAVFVLQGSNGKFPEFPGVMSMLNSPLESLRYGAGIIHKDPMNRSQLTREEARRLWTMLPNVFIAPPTESKTLLTNSHDDEDDEEKDVGFHFSDGGDVLSERSLFSELNQMTQPNHNWLLLHVMFWIYILLIFPGCFLIGKKRNDFRIVYLTIGAVVLVFSVAFGVVGQRGYGESTKLNSVAIVQPLPDGFLDVSQWSNAFVTSGATYDFHHAGIGALYSACQDSESVNGFVQNGSDGLFRVDIPPYSSREFAHRCKVRGQLPDVHVQTVRIEEGVLNEMTLAVDSTFPDTDSIHLLHRDRFYSARRVGNLIQLDRNVGGVPAFLRVQQYQNNYNPFQTTGQSDQTVADRYDDLFFPLATRSLKIHSLSSAQAVKWNAGHVRLMYYADLLPNFVFDKSQSMNQQQGKALYCIDVPFAGSKP